MSEQIGLMPGARQRVLPTGLLGMSILLVVVEWGIAKQARGFLSISAWDWRANLVAAKERSRDCGVLLFGDSLIKFGVFPRALEASYGRPAYNLAAGGGPPPLAYYLLRRALQSGARPSAVVVSCLPRQLTASPERYAELWPYVLTLPECAELCWTARDATLFGKVVLARLLPSLRYRLPIRAVATSPRADQYALNVLLTAVLARECQVNRGAMPQKGLSPGQTHPDLQKWSRDCFTDWACLAVNDYYLRRFLKLAQARRIPVYWVLVPLVNEVQEFCVRTGYDRAHRGYLERLQREFPNLTILDAQESGYDQRAFYDPHHLGIPGALALSADLGDELAQREKHPGTGRRYARLPAYRPRKAEFPLEDHEAAIVAMRQIWSAPRGGSRRK